MKKRLLLTIVTCTLFAGGIMAQYAYFPLNSDVKDTNQAINATASPGGITFVKDSLRGMVAQFSGGTDADTNTAGFVTLDNSIYNQNALTYNIWFEWNNTDPNPWWQRIFDFGERSVPDPGNHDVMFVTTYQDGVLKWHIHPVAWPGGADTVLVGDTIHLGQWYMLTMAENADSAWLYLNGVKWDARATGVSPTAFSFKKCYLGRSNWSDNLFYGKFDDFTVWKKVLTQAEITALYTFPTVKTGIHTTNVLDAKIYSFDNTIRILLPDNVNNASVAVYNMEGMEVYKQVKINSSTRIDNLGSGIYIVRVISSEGVATKKVLIR